jgi:adenosylcobinamide-GDP ribazoletransferase
VNEASPDATGERSVVARSIESFRLAASFLTILPLGPREPAAPESVAESFAYFPIVGFAIGVALCIEDWLLAFLFGHALRSGLIVLSLAVLTGAVHLDALADTADALGAGRNRERALEILRDSAIGSFGAIALIFVLGLKVIALASIGGFPRYAALFVAPGLGRWAMVAVSWRLEYLRSAGAGSALLAAGGGRNFAFASAVSIVAAAIAASSRTLGACVAAVVLAILMRAFYKRWLSGVTGDLIGAAGEIAETVVLVLFAT